MACAVTDLPEPDSPSTARVSPAATLSFLGLGLNGVSWGNDISDGGNSIRVAQFIMLYPSIMLSITVLAFIMLGEAVRNALDPKTR